MSIIHENLEPGVIDSNMIIDAVLEQSPKGEAGRLIAEEGIVLEEVEVLRLEFLNILKIDHLWMMSSLVKLQIGNNIIEKIENLEKLVNLKELDLSFNNIENIENLNTLVNLEVLTLFENKIFKLENLDNLKKLAIFSIGNNNISDWDNVMYLRPFKALRSLNMAGNPCAFKEHFNDYVYAMLPQLVYYEYRMIMPPERQSANKKFKDKQKEIMDAEDKEEEAILADKTDVESIELYMDAFVENLQGDHLFKCLYVSDAEGIAFLKMNEETEDLFCEFREKFLATTSELFNFGLEQHEMRKKEVDEFTECIEEAKQNSMARSREIMNEFIDKKSEIFQEMHKIASSLDDEIEGGEEGDVHNYYERMQACSDNFHELTRAVWQELMKIEMTLYEQIDDTISNFEVSIHELLDQFLEGTQGQFARLREIEGSYSEELSDLANRYLTNRNIRMDDPTFVLEPELKNIMIDKDTLANSLSSSHDAHLQVIDGREDVLNTRSSKWSEDLLENIRKDNVKRNREKIVETSHFMDIQQEEFEDLRLASELQVEGGEDEELQKAPAQGQQGTGEVAQSDRKEGTQGSEKEAEKEEDTTIGEEDKSD